MNKNTTNMHPTLEEVRNKLEHWRKIKRNHREPIPKDLWQAAAEIARKHSINQVSKALHLSYADLKNRVYGPSISKHKNKQKPSSFVELECAQPFLMQETTLEMENPKGSRLKVSFFYKTPYGAYVGDLFMSLIHTCSLCRANPFKYLKTLQENSSLIAKYPEKWMPWNYQEMLESEAK